MRWNPAVLERNKQNVPSELQRSKRFFRVPAFGWTPRPEVKRLNLGIRAVPGRGRFLNTKKHSRWKQNPTQLGERRWRRRGTATGTDLPVAEQPLPLLLRSRRRRGHRHCLPRINRHSPAEASIDPRGEDTGHTPQEEGRREGRGGDGGGGWKAGWAFDARMREERGGYIYGGQY